MEYLLVIRRAENGGYWAEVPALKGCFVQADTLDGLLADAPRAISSHLQELIEGGQQATTDQGIIIATVAISKPLASAREGHQARVFPRGELEQYPIPSGARVPGQEDMPGGNESAESEIAPGVRRTARGWLTGAAHAAKVPLIIWGLLMSLNLMWNAWDARDGAPGPQRAGVPAAAAGPGATRTAPAADPSATAVQPYPAVVVAPTAVVTSATSTMPSPVAVPTATTTARSAGASSLTPATQDAYVVQQGETLFAISQRFRVTVDELVKANDLTDRSFVMAGQRLVIPRGE